MKARWVYGCTDHCCITQKQRCKGHRNSQSCLEKNKEHREWSGIYFKNDYCSQSSMVLPYGCYYAFYCCSNTTEKKRPSVGSVGFRNQMFARLHCFRGQSEPVALAQKEVLTVAARKQRERNRLLSPTGLRHLPKLPGHKP